MNETDVNEKRQISPLTASTCYWVVIQHSRTSYNFIPIIMIIVAFSLSDFDWTFNIAERYEDPEGT